MRMTRLLSATVLGAMLTLAGAMGLASDLLVTASGSLSYQGFDDPEPLTPMCGTCSWSLDIQKQDVINSEECPPFFFPNLERQELNWHCARYECGTVPYVWYKAVIDSAGSCTSAPLHSGSCPSSNCAGGP
jgi:hypothetical protein